MRKVDVQSFALALSALDLTQPGIAVALLWYRDQEAKGAEATASELATEMESLALCSTVNRTRLASQLNKHSAIVRGSKPRTFKLRLGSKSDLDDHFSPLLGGPAPPPVKHAYLPEAQTKGTRQYLVKMAWQLNGCFESGYYDGCAVLCRRLMESLLIEAFEHQGHAAAIKIGKDYKALGEIIGAASSGRHIKLARGTADALERIKKVGDTAAHNRTYITSLPDLMEISHDFRKTISELMTLAGLQSST